MKIVGAWTAIRRELEAAIDRLFALSPEDCVEYDSLLRPDELDRLGYLRNFPHLGCLMCAIDEADLPAFAAARNRGTARDRRRPRRALRRGPCGAGSSRSPARRGSSARAAPRRRRSRRIPSSRAVASSTRATR
jgi:hypothetical protein